MKAAAQQRLINGGVASDCVSSKRPRFPWRGLLRHHYRDAARPPLARTFFIIAIVTFNAARSAAIGVSLLLVQPEVRAFEAVIPGFDELLVRELRARARL